ncbi:hypothetical protein AVEN_61425-1 [Araneus ventricosus]|uniref:Uncharacterized protein n=1 Tax=Araneus ventricosus TaxID=182803 RepID=A0A4Y2RE82_ARAVE|nr:hypothetical protein AVEN_186467-1 [Araneus ventricosus]GBN74855.1 hypothetical protein AVEN_61425-1 [Araneus ventricosus]
MFTGCLLFEPVCSLLKNLGSPCSLYCVRIFIWGPPRTRFNQENVIDIAITVVLDFWFGMVLHWIFEQFSMFNAEPCQGIIYLDISLQQRIRLFKDADFYLFG